MIATNTKAFGHISAQRQLAEFHLVLSTVDAAITRDVAGIADIMTWFDPQCIADPYYRAIFSQLIQMRQQDGPVDIYTIAKGLHACGKEYDRTILDIGNLILDCTEQRAHLRFYASEVLREYRRRGAAADISGAADDMIGTADPDAVLEYLPEIANKYASPVISRSTDNQKVIDDIIGELEGRQQDTAFQFGIAAIDNIIGGVPAGALVTVGARTSCGKSVFLGQAALKCANIDGKPALVFSCEMTQKELAKRWASALSRQPHPKQGGKQRQFIGGVARVKQLLDTKMLHVFTGAKTVEQIVAEATAYAARCELGLIVVDYIQAIMPTRSRSEGREQQVAHIAASLKHLASTTGVPVLTASQLNKDGNESPRLSTMRESEAIGNYSNLVLLLDPERTPDNVCSVDINVAKNRDGETNLVVGVWEKHLYTIRDKDVHDMPNYDPVFAGVTEADLPGIVEDSRRKQPNWKDRPSGYEELP
jgi:replicative DNA helicase